jgi:superfamily II DNA or RNA helicase
MSKTEKDYSYPNPDDDNFQEKIFKKREFYYHRIPDRKIMKTYEEIQKYREENCQPGFEPRDHQKILTNFISPNTPYKGLLLLHGTGTGKSASCISIAEQFKNQVKKYNTKIYVLVPGPNTRENFKSELLFSTGKTYLKNKDILDQMNNFEVDRERKIGIYSALQYYKILSYKTFYRKVLGEKIIEKKISNDKVINTYKKKENGEFERELVVDKITNMDNSIIIVDEAHNLTGNEYGEALKTIIKKSKNLKVILLTATPMKNLADDIIDLLNFIRPPDKPIKRDEIFTNERNYNMKLKEGAEIILKEKSRGYISYFRGSIPFTFAKRIDKGEVPPGMLFTPVIRCYMEKFQLITYTKTTLKLDDTLDRAASASANFVFPGLSPDKKKLIGYYSTDGMNKLISQINTDKKKLINMINKEIYKNKIDKNDISNFFYENDKKGISGSILDVKYLKNFSIKFYKCIKRLEKLVIGNKGPGTSFVYSNLVKAGGMELFSECLKENGYLDYQDDFRDYDIKDDTIDALTGKTFLQFKKEKKNMKDFYPSTYLLVTGGTDDSGEDIPEIKQKIIREVFNNYENREGKNLKVILGSKVMNEGITLENVREIHILDVHYNLGKVLQVIGRGIRMCKHQAVISDDNKFPQVNVYRYVVSIKNKLSTDELLYKKAELKFLLVKRVERILKESSIDCPLLLNGNKFPEEVQEYKDCVYPTLENIKKKKKICPSLCDFESCDIKCDNPKLNRKFWDNKSKSYIIKNDKNIDYNTFNDDLAKFEIIEVKNKIIDLFRFKHVYMYDELLDIILNSYNDSKKKLFNEYFLDQALELLMPKTENDFNDFRDSIFDKKNRSGYIIQRDNYYIFQPFDENEDVPLYYRKQNKIKQNNLVHISNYIKNNFDYKSIKDHSKTDKYKEKKGYDFDTTMNYYEKREENFIVGIIDKKTSSAEGTKDIFKIREPRAKVLDKKRGTGIPTLKGAVCSTSKDKNYLLKILNKIPNNKHVEVKKTKTRDSLCNLIMKKLLYLEKFSTTKDKNKLTYIMIPANHDKYSFPYNLEDRIKDRIKKVNKIINRDINIKVNKHKNGIFNGKRISDLLKYIIILENSKYVKENEKQIKNLGFNLVNKNWELVLE